MLSMKNLRMIQTSSMAKGNSSARGGRPFRGGRGRGRGQGGGRGTGRGRGGQPGSSLLQEDLDFTVQMYADGRLNLSVRVATQFFHRLQQHLQFHLHQDLLQVEGEVRHPNEDEDEVVPALQGDNSPT